MKMFCRIFSLRSIIQWELHSVNCHTVSCYSLRIALWDIRAGSARYLYSFSFGCALYKGLPFQSAKNNMTSINIDNTQIKLSFLSITLDNLHVCQAVLKNRNYNMDTLQSLFAFIRQDLSTNYIFRGNINTSWPLFVLLSTFQIYR